MDATNDYAKRPASAWLVRPAPRTLAPWAMGEDQAGQRKHAESEHPYRTALQRDRDRVVHCTAFRRLDFKTQVYVPHDHDHYRTRMTHTLEVAQIARTGGRALGLNEDLLEATALAHDLGHPPFGHGGEEALNDLMAGHGGFEHNRQSLRVVDYLEHPYPAFRGLNLTRAVRECLAKHRTRFDTPVCEDFDQDEPAPLEGQLVDLADEIAYTSADLDDSLSAGTLTAEQLQRLSLWRQAWATAEADAPGASWHHRRIRACKAVLASMMDDMLVTTAANIDAMGIRSPGDARSAAARCVCFSPATAQAVREVQQFLLETVYLGGENLVRDREGKRLISELFGAYIDKPSLLPERYLRRAETDGLQRLVCDYVAGMTDRFCRAEHRRICGA